MSRRRLPEPDCEWGYTMAQLEQMLGGRYTAFQEWMRGQTGAICDGLRYDHDERTHQPTECGPHGFVTYPWDVQQFLAGGEPLD